MSSLVDTGPYRTKSSYHIATVSAPQTHSETANTKSSVDAPVTVTARSLRTNAVFSPIRDAIIDLARRAIQQQLHSNQEDDADDDKYLSENSDDDIEDEKEINDERMARIFRPEFILDGYIFAPKEFDILMERLPSSFGDYKMKYEMFDGKVTVRTVPSTVHGNAVDVFTHTVHSWADDPANRGPAGSPLEGLSDSNYYYTNRKSKSPDSSFVPKTISIPPALAQPNSVSVDLPNGAPFPTIVFECVYQNEKWSQLISDARNKTFARTTSVQVWIGIKVYQSRREMRAIWGKRCVKGYDMCIMKVTHPLSVDNPTHITLTIPAALIFWGCPQIPPYLIGSNCIFTLETFRQAICKHIRRQQSY